MILTRIWEPGMKLGDNEWLLKIRKSSSDIDTGFYAKLTKKGELQKSFHEWGNMAYNRRNVMEMKEELLPVYIVEETFRSGWKLKSWRFGQSQNWVRLVHPWGFTLEIYLTDFLNVVQSSTIVEGEIQGEFKWEDNRLIKKP